MPLAKLSTLPCLLAKSEPKLTGGTAGIPGIPLSFFTKVKTSLLHFLQALNHTKKLNQNQVKFREKHKK
ncbi:hypothetical protein SY212_12650 [Ligilactobacillus agilis]|uniref:Uncharacterized protein n=1 Tax=Ligilactobacillus agilis TaxID=1601 RepID=A0A6F9XM16_9LACO|nr:hypothetical protein SY212_12650 [Ligilactobacillus agilis]